MSHSNTIFSQILKLVPRHEFERLAKQHHSGRSFRTASRWSQFVMLTLAQLSGRLSLSYSQIWCMPMNSSGDLVGLLDLFSVNKLHAFNDHCQVFEAA